MTRTNFKMDSSQLANSRPAIILEVGAGCLEQAHTGTGCSGAQLVRDLFDELYRYDYGVYWTNGMKPVDADFCLSQMHRGTMDVFALMSREDIPG